MLVADEMIGSARYPSLRIDENRLAVIGDNGYC